MTEDHFRTLTETVSAKSLREIGEARGYKGQYAIEAGRRLLVAANDNLMDALKLAEEGKAEAA
ncbi:hypothetical protein LJR098_002010 [Rhizobium sp. LjRoot98]|uniref:hypothetical protein n=1 Tax=unclassified Rhizobium TaxID=2613769 RepID=UPI000712DF6C|nr:hypothetical protein [Rhizobium sp. Root1204]KQV37748.1 hypothetical protein ASC96_26105 [Rhizobium sp. Root1204]